MKKILAVLTCSPVCPFYNILTDDIETKCTFYDRTITPEERTHIGRDEIYKPSWCKLNEIEASDYSTSNEREGVCGICKETKKDCRHLPIYVWGSEGVWACLDCRKILGELIRTLTGFIMDANKRAYHKLRKKGGKRLDK